MHLKTDTNLTQVKGEKSNSAMVVGDFNTSFQQQIEKLGRRSTGKWKEQHYNAPDPADRTRYTTAEHTFFCMKEAISSSFFHVYVKLHAGIACVLGQKRKRRLGWFSELGIQLQLRSWFHGSWVRALRRALSWQLRARSLLRILCPSLSAPPLFTLCLCLSLTNK